MPEMRTSRWRLDDGNQSIRYNSPVPERIERMTERTNRGQNSIVVRPAGWSGQSVEDAGRSVAPFGVPCLYAQSTPPIVMHARVKFMQTLEGHAACFQMMKCPQPSPLGVRVVVQRDVGL